MLYLEVVTISITQAIAIDASKQLIRHRTFPIATHYRSLKVTELRLKALALRKTPLQPHKYQQEDT